MDPSAPSVTVGDPPTEGDADPAELRPHSFRPSAAGFKKVYHPGFFLLTLSPN